MSRTDFSGARAAAAFLAVGMAMSACGPAPDEGVNRNLGAGIYLKNCVACHGENGEPRTPNYPPLRDSPWLKGPPEPLIAIILDGASGPFEVDGHTYKGIMPAWRDILSDEDIANVLSFLRKEFANQTPAIPAAEVASVRERTASRHAFWTEQELKAMPRSP